VGRPLTEIRSDLRGAIAFRGSGGMPFQTILIEAKAACGSPDEFKAVLRELGMNENEAAAYCGE
jgi:hypothetical protein